MKALLKNLRAKVKSDAGRKLIIFL